MTGSSKLTMVLFSKMLSCLVFLENSVRHSWNFLVELLGHLRLEKTIYKQVGEKLEGAMGINPILSKDEIFGISMTPAKNY